MRPQGAHIRTRPNCLDSWCCYLFWQNHYCQKWWSINKKTTFKYRLLHITINIYGTFIIRGSLFVSSQILPHDEGAFLYPRKIQPHSEGVFLYLSMNDCINKNSQALKCYDLSQTHCSQSEPEWVTSMFLKSQPVVTRGSAAT